MRNLDKAIEDLNIWIIGRAEEKGFRINVEPLHKEFQIRENKIYVNITNIKKAYKYSKNNKLIKELSILDFMEYIKEHITPILLKNKIKEFHCASLSYKRIGNKYAIIVKG